MKKIYKKLKIFFRNTTNRKLMFNYLLIFIVITIFSFVSFFALDNILSSKFNENNQLIINTITNSLNDVFKNVDDVYKSVEEVYSSNDIFSMQGIINSDNNTKMNFSYEINKNILSNDFIEEIVFLKKDEPLLITSQGTIDKTEFFNQKYNSELYGLSYFNNISTDYMNLKVVPASAYKNLVKYPTEDPKRLFVFVKTLQNSDINIIIFISEERFIRTANLDTIEDKVKFRIYDYNNTMVFTNTDVRYAINTTGLNSEFTKEVIKKGLKTFYITKSNYNYFYYMAEIDNYILQGGIMAFIILLLGMIVAFAIMLIRIKSTRTDLFEVYDVLELDNKTSYLDDVVKKSKYNIEKIAEYQNELGEMSGEVTNSIFVKMINSSSYYNRNKKIVEIVFQKLLSKDKYLLLSVEVARESLKQIGYEISEISKVLNNISLEYIVIDETQKKHLFILGYMEHTKMENIVKSMELLSNSFREKYIEVLISVSKEFDNLSNLYNAYDDIKICRDYRGVKDKHIILNVKDIAYGSNLYLPLNYKEELKAKIMSKEENMAKDYIKTICETNIQNNIPIIKFEFMLRLMQNAIIEVLSMSKREKMEIFELEQIFISKINSFNEDYDTDAIINSFMNLIHMSISLCESKKTTLNRSDVIKYINSHYAEDLYLEKIAGVFTTTAKYFSNYFKKEFSVGFNEYLTQIRISHAKKILAETELPLNEIGEKVGYSNQATFAVAFKKNVGSPPGKYREINKNKNK